MSNYIQAVNYSQLPQVTQNTLNSLNTKYGYQDFALDWNGTVGSNDLLINGIPATDKRYSLTNVPAFTISLENNTRIANFILSNIADDFQITIKDKYYNNNIATYDNTYPDPPARDPIVLPEVVITDLYQFPVISDDELQTLNTNTFIRKLVNGGVLGRNKLIELIRPKEVTQYKEGDEIIVSITNNNTLTEFSIIFKSSYHSDTADWQCMTVYPNGTVFNMGQYMNSSRLDNILPVPYKVFTVGEDKEYPIASFEILRQRYNNKSDQSLNVTRTMLYNKQLLNLSVFYFKGENYEKDPENFDKDLGLKWVNIFNLRSEKAPTTDHDFMNDYKPSDGNDLSLVTSMSLKAFSFPLLIFITGSYSRWNNNTNDAYPTFLETMVVKPYLGTLRASISNNQILIPSEPDDTGNGTYTWESELKYPDLSDITKVYSDTSYQPEYITYDVTSPNEFTSLAITPIEVDGVKTGKYKTVTHYEKENVDYVVATKLKGTYKNFSYTETINIGTSESSGDIIFPQGNQISLMKGKSSEFKFYGTKAAKVEFVDNSGTSGITIDAILDQTDPLPNEIGDKFYSNFTGKATVTVTDKSTVASHVLSCQLKNTDDSILGTTDYTVIVTAPLAEPDIVNGKVLQINKDVKTTLQVTCKDTFLVELVNADQLKYTEVKLGKVTHSDTTNDSNAYDEYSFKLSFTPKGNIGDENLIIRLSDQDKKVVVEKAIVLNVYDPIYSPIEKYINRLDGEAGHKVKFSYTEKKGYIVPAAFINNGEEVASILVPKYPLSQESVSGSTVNDTISNLSKPYRSRVRVYKNAKVKTNTGPEGGDLYKVIMPDALDNVMNNIKNSDLLNNRAYVVANSASLDTMLANMSDASFLAKMESTDLSNNSNFSLDFKPLNPDKDITNAGSDSLFKIDNQSYDIKLTISRTKDQTYTTVSEVKDVLYNQGAIWNTGRFNYTPTSNGMVELATEKILGEMQSAAYNTLDKTKTIAFPIISSYSTNTHNGEANGIVDAFGSGIKVYSDILYENVNGEDIIKVLDPYITQVDYDINSYDTREDNFVKLEFKENMYLTNTSSVCYIGPNENKSDLATDRSVYSNYTYDKFKQGYLMDSVGLPMDNTVIDYPDDITFKGNAGYSTVPNYQYGRSAYYVDYKHITNNGGTKGYFVSGTVGNDRLIFGNRDEIHTDPQDWVNLYSGKRNIIDSQDEFGKGSMTAGNRTRVLLNEDTLYGINKNKGYTDDNIYYNNRLHFFIYDKDRVDRPALTKLDIKERFIEVEESKSVTLDIVTDGTLEYGTYDKKSLYVDQNTNKITGLVPGDYELDLTAKATGKDPITKRLYIRVIDLLPVTYLSTDITDIIGKTDDTKYVAVTTNANDISTVVTSEHAEIVNKSQVASSDDGTGNNIFSFGVLLKKPTQPETSIIISATADSSKTTAIEIPIVITQRVPTKYEILVKNFSVSTKAELQGTLNSNYLAKKLGLDESGINLTSPRQICIWSQQLAGQAWKVNSDYTFGIDFGSANYNTYIINYEAQLDQEYEFTGFIPATKPNGNVSPNLNSTISGTITISVLTT